MEDFIKALETEFRKNTNSKIALEQKAYLRNQFEFFGLKTPVRRKTQKVFLEKKHLPPKKELEQIVKTLWLKPEREYHYFAQELTQKYLKQLEEKDIELFEFMITNQSWWDTVDMIAVKAVGSYFKTFPDKRNEIVEKWLASGNMWLKRTSILFQLHYKEDLDKEFLSYVINSLLGSNEFFINKAIGWILRHYSRTNPEWVIDFAENTELHKLSQKEALRLLKT
ncbi:MAG: DNA alkylation repair protein [Bacteroidetes bacterium 4572_117]|nr:MAG: DNA alkylation repair protein [Bacteroidetes bacterium 4572_117]